MNLTRADFIPVHVHRSQYPAEVRAALLCSLRSRQINHKFHYASYKQASLWNALFNSYSPFVNDPACRRMYQSSFQMAARVVGAGPLQVIGLGCGSGDKDVQLLESLRNLGARAAYVPVDASMPLVLTAYQKANSAGFGVSAGVVCDLLTPFAWREDSAQAPRSSRLVTFFGMIPNFEPKTVWPNLAAALVTSDFLLLSANLAPGEDYNAGLREVMAQYDNADTAAWLLTFLGDIGAEAADGSLRWCIEPDANYPNLKRFTAYFEFVRDRAVVVEGEEFSFAPGDRIRLFFSYRYDSAQLRRIAEEHGLRVQETWATPEEAVVLCQRI